MLRMVVKVAMLCSGLLSKQVHTAVYHRGNYIHEGVRKKTVRVKQIW
jgi:hypothetical protein